mmetsp:Transcript_21122/g.29840  ORF Transcript_21122/g.29840 Transcript_21122/m.29840 type:complete len:218 (-) Transcript_21122:279-932(-)
MKIVLGFLFAFLGMATAFQTNGGGSTLTAFHRPMSKTKTTLFQQAPEEYADVTSTAYLEEILAANYPQLMQLLLSKNDGIWKALRKSNQGYTIFAPNAQAFADLGEKKVEQLADPRNLETAEKVASYHVIAEAVTADQLFASGGVITMGGEIPIGRSTTGGFFGIGGQEDGGVTVNGANVVETFVLDGGGVIHEVDKLISPQVLWRYVDQLRIPGSS